MRVPLTHRDLERLTRFTTMPAECFVEWLAPEEIDMEGEPESFVQLDVGRRLLVLRHEGGACHLLDAAGRCRTYQARPAPCAAYPYAIDGCGSSDSRRRLFVLSDAPCGDGVAEGGDAARAAAEVVETELLEYVDVVARWNRRQNRRRLAGHRPHSGNQFLAFVRVTSDEPRLADDA